MEEDKELQNMIEMEFEYKKACELYEQFTSKVILKRLAFQSNCPHTETYSKEDVVFAGQGIWENVVLTYCKRCKKFLKQTVKNDSEKTN